MLKGIRIMAAGAKGIWSQLHGIKARCSICTKNISDDILFRELKAFCRDCESANICEQGGICLNCNQTFLPGQKKWETCNKEYHNICFLCSHCNCIIESGKYLIHDSSYICHNCFYNDVLKTCSVCNQKIEGEIMKHKENCFHQDCLLCSSCNCKLHDKPIVEMENRKYCENCYASNFSNRCSKCDEAIKAGIKFVTLDEKFWHTNCFTCSSCSDSLSEQPEVVFRNGSEMCRNCLTRVKACH